MKDYKTKGDTLITKWYPKDPGSDKYYYFVLISIKKKLKYIKAYESETYKLLKKVVLKDYKSIGKNFLIPSKAVIYTNGNMKQYSEKVILNNIDINQSIPDSLLNLKIPKDVKIEDKKW